MTYYQSGMVQVYHDMFVPGKVSVRDHGIWHQPPNVLHRFFKGNPSKTTSNIGIEFDFPEMGGIWCPVSNSNVTHLKNKMSPEEAPFQQENLVYINTKTTSKNKDAGDK